MDFNARYNTHNVSLLVVCTAVKDYNEPEKFREPIFYKTARLNDSLKFKLRLSLRCEHAVKSH